MHSIVIYLAGVTRDVVRVQLSEFAETVRDDEWQYPLAKLPVLYIGFYDYEPEFELGELQPLQLALDEMPDVAVIANVSGRVPGDSEVKLFTECLLGQFRGIACDEHSNHCWTLAEIRSQATALGHPFFDYEGWHRDTPAA